MNDRIFELAKQAGLQPYYYAQEQHIQKFAELIVRECINVVDGGIFLHDQAPTAIVARECSGAIKRHFGVES